MIKIGKLYRVRKDLFDFFGEQEFSENEVIIPLEPLESISKHDALFTYLSSDGTVQTKEVIVDDFSLMFELVVAGE